MQEIFPVNSVGIVTARDSFVIDSDQRRLKRRITQFVDSSFDDEFVGKEFGLKDTGAWKIEGARKALSKEEDIDKYFTRILYRPFDTQYLFYHDAVIERARREVMRHMLQENFALIVPRRVETAIPWSHVLVSNNIVEHVAVSLKTIDYCFPLYLYPERKKAKQGSGVVMMLFEPDMRYEGKDRIPNIAPKLLENLTARYEKEPSPEEIFNYIYAVLYSNAYRKKYAEFLKTDFPRVPFTSDCKLFLKLAGKGKDLVELHLLKSRKLEKPMAKCEGSGNLRVEKVAYDESKKRVHINPETYFADVPKEVWEYHIGGYQVADKWLKDRKGRTLSSEEVAHYCRVVTALSETIKVQAALGELFKEVEKNIIAMPMQ